MSLDDDAEVCCDTASGICTGSPHNLQCDSLSQPSEVWITQSPLSGKSRSSKKSRGATFTNYDLQNQSILALSSSEDEDEVDTLTRNYKASQLGKAPPSYSKSHAIVCGANATPLALRATFHEQVEIIPSRQVPMLTPKELSGVSKRSNTPDSLPTPYISKFRHGRASGHSMADSSHDDFRPKSSNDAVSQAATKSVSFASMSVLSSTSDSGLQTRKSRIMAVTREEESLLEAMRHKRAVMRQGRANQISDRRPEQAHPGHTLMDASPGLDVSQQDSKSAADPIPVPSSWPSSSPRLDHAMVAFGFSDSTSNASNLERGLAHAARPVSYIPAPQISPSIHFTPSEYQSSTPPSRASPKTPPSGYASSTVLVDSTGTTASSPADLVPAQITLKCWGEECNQ